MFLPRVIPLGHWMSDATKTCLSTPFIPDFSILAGSPQSDQYRNLQPHTHTCTRFYKTDPSMYISAGDKMPSPGMKRQAVHPPRKWIHGDGGWFFEPSVKQNLLLGSIEVGNRNCFGAKIRPVQVLIDPVHSDSHRSLDIVYHFVVCADFSPFVQHSAVRNKT